MQAERLPGPDLTAINLLAQYADSFLPRKLAFTTLLVTTSALRPARRGGAFVHHTLGDVLPKRCSSNCFAHFLRNPQARK